MNLKYQLFLVLIVVIGLTHSQEKDSIPIKIGYVEDVTLEAQQKQLFTISIDYQLEPYINMYVLAESPFNDPFEEPYLTIKSDNNYRQECFEESNEFTGICFVKNQQLKVGREFTIETYCLVNCSFKLSAYYSQVAPVTFGENVRLEAYSDFGVAQGLSIKIPQNQNFTDIYIVASIVNKDQVYEGLKMYANYGSGNVSMPSQVSYQKRGQAAWGQSQAIFLSKNEISPGDTIKLFMFLGQNMTVELYSSSVNGNRRKITLGKELIDFTTDSEQKYYILDLRGDKYKKITEYDVDILFIIYSGLPQIQVSFDEGFSEGKVIDNYYVDSTINYLLSPALREEKGFNGMIYIKVASIMSSNYFLTTGVNKKDFVDLKAEITELVRVPGNYVQNFIFQDINRDNGKKQQIISYKTSLQMFEGGLLFGNRVCYSLQQNDNLDCLITEKNFLQDNATRQSFEEIEANVSHYYNLYQIFWSYDVNKCPEYKNAKMSGHICQFQIVVESITEEDTYAALTQTKRTIHRELRQGVIFRDYLLREDYHYYSFTLTNVKDIVEVNIFTTVIDGDIGLLFSKTKKFPQILDSGSEQVQLYLYDSIILNRNQIGEGTYYVGVYSYEISQYTISMAIERKIQNETKITEIELKNGLTQKYTLDEGKQQVDFIYKSTQNNTMIVTITNLKSHVQYQIINKKTNQTVNCSGDSCAFAVEENVSYRIRVTGKEDKVQIFTIIIGEKQTCVKYPIDFPLFVILENTTACYQYNVPENQYLSISIELTALDLLKKDISIRAQFPSKTLNITENDKIITKQQLEQYCKVESKQICTMKLSFSSKEDLIFQAAVQTGKGENVLFNGISEQAYSDAISPQNAKQFYYYIYNIETVSIILNPKTNNGYQVLAKAVSVKDFATAQLTSEDIYPKFNETNPHTVSTYSSTPLTVLMFPKEKLTQMDCELCVLLISVYGLSANKKYMFTIEATQTERKLTFGANKIGYLGKDEAQQYEIKVYPDKPALITVNVFEEKVCLSSYVRSPSGQMIQFQEYQTFQNLYGDYVIVLESKAEKCAYQIFYSSTETPITQILSSINYKVQLSKGNEKYFLYYHNKAKSFRIIETVDTGDAKIAAMAVEKGKLQQYLNKNIEQYDFFEKNTINDLLVEKENEKFCSECNYLVVVKGDPHVSQQLIIIDSDVPIPLKDGATFKDSTKKASSKLYSFYSYTSFNVSLNILYGKANLLITNPSKAVVLNKTLGLSDEFLIEGPPSTNDSVNYFDDRYKYTIEVQGKSEVGYSIRAHKQNATIRITEGIPIRMHLSPNKGQLLSFKNLNEEGTINVLVENMNFTQKPAKLTFTAFVRAENNKPVTDNAITTTSQSEGSYNVELKALKGNYMFNVRSDMEIDISIVYAKKSLTHLQAANTMMVKNPNTFEIYSPGDSIIIEVYDCRGSVAVEGSSSYYDLLQGKNTIMMEHSNYGGHYVISAPKLNGEYFIKANQNEGSQVLYLITYYLYSSPLMPYKYYNIKNTQIQFKNHKDTIEFNLNPVEAKRNAPSIMDITYSLYISNSSEAVDQFVSCSIGSVFKKVSKFQEFLPGKVKFEFEKSQIDKIVGGSDSYEVSAEVYIRLINDEPEEIPALNFAYERTYVTVGSEPVYGEHDNLRFVLLFIVLPFLLACFLLYLAGRYCLKNLAAYPTNQLIEEEEYGESEEQFNTSAK